MLYLVLLTLYLAVEGILDPNFQTGDNYLPKHVGRRTDDDTSMFSFGPIQEFEPIPLDPCCYDYEHDCPRDHKWHCNTSIKPIVCGHSCDNNWRCICDQDIDGVQQCYQQDYCQNRPVCTSSNQCLADEVCVVSCCGNAPRCFKECEVPTPVPTLKPTGEPTRRTEEPTQEPIDKNNCPCKVQSSLPWQCNFPAEECHQPDPTSWWGCYCLPQVPASQWIPNDENSNACIENNWCSAAPNCNDDVDCPVGYECIPHTCCPDHPGKCAKCCDNNEPIPTPEPTYKPTPEPTYKPTPEPTRPTRRPTPVPTRQTKSPTPQPIDDETCPCDQGSACIPGTGLSWPTTCHIDADGNKCSCTKPHPLSPTQDGYICIREWFDPLAACNDFIRFPRCMNGKCPVGHHCVESCCPDNKIPRCVPCCDTEYRTEPWP